MLVVLIMTRKILYTCMIELTYKNILYYVQLFASHCVSINWRIIYFDVLGSRKFYATLFPIDEEKIHRLVTVMFVFMLQTFLSCSILIAIASLTYTKVLITIISNTLNTKDLPIGANKSGHNINLKVLSNIWAYFWIFIVDLKITVF